MKKIIIIVVSLLIVSVLAFFGIKKYQAYKEEERIRNAIIKVELIDDLDIEFNSKIHLSDLLASINGELIDDVVIDTKELGEKTIAFKYINEETIKVPYQFTINIVDKTPPVIWLNDTYTLKVGSNTDLTKAIMCGDNYDSNPQKEIIGEYNLAKVGTYHLTYKATDNSGNITMKDFDLIIKKSVSSSSSTKKIPFADLYNKYKTTNTKVGIDVSKWQGKIDYQKVKDAGAEFVIIKIGGTNGLGGDYYLDPKFKDNIEGFTNVGLPIGVYFYTYADSVSKAKEDAQWVIENLKDYNISLPIAYDWENWSKFNSFNMSFYELTESAKAFINEVNKAGYEGLLYSSKNYLEKIWLKDDYPVWLAHYTDQTTYQGEYQYWQMTSSAVISGITGNTVDVDIMYLN